MFNTGTTLARSESKGAKGQALHPGSMQPENHPGPLITKTLVDYRLCRAIGPEFLSGPRGRTVTYLRSHRARRSSNTLRLSQ